MWIINQDCNQKRFQSVYYQLTPRSVLCSKAQQSFERYQASRQPFRLSVRL